MRHRPSLSVRLASALPLLILANCGGDTDDTSTALGMGFTADDKSRGGTVELCDGVDNNANGRVDEACGQCDYLATRAKTFWTRQACAVEGGATGESLLPITLGAQSFATFTQVRTFLNRDSTTNNTLGLGQEIVTAKLNAAALNIGDVVYIDVTRDSIPDSVNLLVSTAEAVYTSGPASAKVTWRTTMATFNAVGAAVPVYFDATCVAESEICDGADNDGDGRIDENCGCIEVCDGLDNDADGLVDDDAVDGDADGYACDDCDDADATVHPGAAETANGIDDNCDGSIDEGLDGDGDGYTVADGDCDDADAAINPGAAETCNGIDDNCSGTVDEGVTNTYFQDGDSDGYGDAAATTSACSAPPGYVSNTTDCDDSNGSVHPGAAEVCNGIDDNCSGTVDEGVLNTYYRDADGDGYGVSSSTTACTAPSGYVSNSTDCNDSSGSVHPGATETCNGIDDNCSGTVDEGVLNTYYRDTDGDGYGVSTSTTTGCSAPSGYASTSTDCNDGSSSVYPGAVEVVGDGVDQSCDGGEVCYVDVDRDHYRTTSGSTVLSADTDCNDAGEAMAANPATDCNDANIAINPGVSETCNGIDDNCSGVVDEGVTTTYYRDSDSDTYGSASTTSAACSLPSGYVTNSTDCNDASSAIHPGATEIRGDGIDQDCSGADLPFTYSYATNVQPIFNTYCTGCHNAGGAYGLDLQSAVSYSKLVNVASGELPSMDRVEPGSYATSYLYNKLIGNQVMVGGSGSSMPQGSPQLSAANKTIVRTWITEGAPNN